MSAVDRPQSGDYPQVGRGWAFPPRWARAGEADDGSGDVGPDAGLDAGSAGPGPGGGPVAVAVNEGAVHLEEAMEILLRTQVGSRGMRPDFGAGIDRYVFEPRTPEACFRLADDVRRALLVGEPRVIVDAVEAVPAGDAEDRVDVAIEYRIDRHRRPASLVVPFHLGGAP